MMMKVNMKTIVTKGITGTALLAVGLCAAACSDDDDPDDVITTEVNPSTDFTEFETFAFTTAGDMGDQTLEIPADVAANLEVVNDAIRDELTDKGLVEVAVTENPDLRVSSLASTEDVESIYWACADSYWYGYWYWSWQPCSWIQPVYTEYTEGTILIGIVDPTADELVFGGLIEGVADGSEDVEERIQEDVDDVFDAYPEDQTGD
ncbi:MAG TPA: DUF4136 domain-containing protein [Polyangiaceae bacterium]